jgi:hypothetical protein
MAGIDKATGRVATVLVLLVLAAIAVRGHLPGGERAPAPPPSDSPASLIALIALLAVALAGFAFAVITAPRKPTEVGPGDGIGRLELRGLQVRLRWRWVLLAVAVALAWLLVVVLITRLTATPVLPAPGPTVTQTPAPPPGSAPRRAPDPTGSSPSAFGYLAGATVALLLIVAFGIVRQARRAGQPPTLPQDGIRTAPRHVPRGPERLARAAELGLEEIGDLSRDPRAAIIACYVAMERALAHAPGAVPLDSDTPSEVLARAVQHHALSAESATELVALFTEARFSPHVMNEVHREAAIQALRRVLAELRSLA